MRVTSNLFPSTLKNQLNDLQTRQLRYQNQLSTGRKLEQSSDNPGDYGIAQTATEAQSALLGYQRSSDTSQLTLSRNQSSMAQLHKLVSRAYELGQRGNNVYNSGDLKAWSTELTEIIRQVADLANTKIDGNYLFGGTENKPAIIDSTTGAPPVPGANVANFVLNPTTTTNVTTAQINQSYTINTGIVAGNGAAGVTGFLWNGTTNILSALQAANTTLGSGNILTPAQADNLRLSQDIVSGAVGQTASRLSALEANNTRLRDENQTAKERVVDLTQANLADAMTELQKTQLHYQAALQSGGKILNLSLLDYIR